MKKYEELVIQITLYEKTDIITASVIDSGQGDNELPLFSGQ